MTTGRRSASVRGRRVPRRTIHQPGRGHEAEASARTVIAMPRRLETRDVFVACRARTMTAHLEVAPPFASTWPVPAHPVRAARR